MTPETFAKWKQTRMDKKTAEEDAMRKAKDTQAAAGKNSGMSGRDLVSTLLPPFTCAHAQVLVFAVSSRTTPNGSRTKKRKRTSGISPSTGKRGRTRRLRQRKSGSITCIWRTTRRNRQRKSNKSTASECMLRHIPVYACSDLMICCRRLCCPSIVYHGLYSTCNSVWM